MWSRMPGVPSMLCANSYPVPIRRQASGAAESVWIRDPGSILAMCKRPIHPLRGRHQRSPPKIYSGASVRCDLKITTVSPKRTSRNAKRWGRRSGRGLSTASCSTAFQRFQSDAELKLDWLARAFGTWWCRTAPFLILWFGARASPVGRKEQDSVRGPDRNPGTSGAPGRSGGAVRPRAGLAIPIAAAPHGGRDRRSRRQTAIRRARRWRGSRRPRRGTRKRAA